MQSCNLTSRPLPKVVRSASYHAHLCFQRCLGVPPDMLTCAFYGSKGGYVDKKEGRRRLHTSFSTFLCLQSFSMLLPQQSPSW